MNDPMFSSMDLVTILNKVVDDCEVEGYTPDQATIVALGTNMMALAQALVEQTQEQMNNVQAMKSVMPEELQNLIPFSNGKMVLVSTQFIYGLIDTANWLHSRLELSRLDQETPRMWNKGEGPSESSPEQ